MKPTKTFLTFLLKIIVKFIYYLIFFIGTLVITAVLTDGAWQSLVLPFLVTPALFTYEFKKGVKQ